VGSSSRQAAHPAYFWLKIASSGRGALAGTRWAQFNCDDKKARGLAGEDKPREDQCHDKRRMKHVEKTNNFKFFCPRVGEHWE
jgi:hypothetical protein